MKKHCMHNDPLFDADFGLVESLGLTFFENEAGNAVTVNGVSYRNKVTDFDVFSTVHHSIGLFLQPNLTL